MTLGALVAACSQSDAPDSPGGASPDGGATVPCGSTSAAALRGCVDRASYVADLEFIAAPRHFILAAEKDYECVGQTPNVVFTSGAVVMPDGALNVYYGCADTRMALAQSTVERLVDYCTADGPAS